MEKINDGGPAFPAVSEVVGHMPDGSLAVKDITSGGMSLRDKFADSALPAVLYYGYSMGIMDASKAADECYMIADAMIKAREVKS